MTLSNNPIESDGPLRSEPLVNAPGFVYSPDVPDVPLKTTKAKVGAGIAVVGTTLQAAALALPVDGTAHLVIGLCLVALSSAGVYFGVRQTTNEPL